MECPSESNRLLELVIKSLKNSTLKLEGKDNSVPGRYAFFLNCSSFCWMGKSFWKERGNSKLVIRVMIP